MAKNRIGFSSDFVLKDREVGIGTTNPLQTLHVEGNFLVAAGTTTGKHITLKPYDTNNGTLSWEGSEGQLFSITNNLTEGSVFSINDSSAVPIVDALANGTLQLVPYGGEVAVGKTTASYPLDVRGIIKVSDGLSGDAFNAYPFYSGITSSVFASPTGVLNPIVGFPTTSGKRYIVHSINVANVARVQPAGAGATVQVSIAGTIEAAYLNVPGEGYIDPPEVTIESLTGSGAIITSEVDSDGKIIRLNVIAAGTGYTTSDASGNNDANNVVIELPPLAKTEVGVDVEIDRIPVGGGSSVSSYLAFDVPIPAGGVLEVLKQPAVMNPGDVMKIRGIDADGSGLSDAIDVCISYEETHDNYIGYGTATPANVGLGTAINNITLISATDYPVLIQSIRLTNTEFVGDYDVSVKAVTGAGQTFYLARNLIIPSFASVELCDTPKRIEVGTTLYMDAETVGVDANEASTIDIQVSGRNITI